MQKNIQMKVLIILLFTLSTFFSSAQNFTKEINKNKSKIALSEKYIDSLLKKNEDLKLKRIQKNIQKYGLPELSENNIVVNHSAMSLCYDEEHEQAKWVVHIITPDIASGKHGRTNDFRVDPKVKTQTAIKEDYWESGYDRGHLAPSADFKWSKKAISESYYYSNMSPQRPEMNREIWAELESAIREYVIEKKQKVYVVTGGILKKGLQKIGKKNKISIPEKFFKIVIDIEGDTVSGIGFVVPNEMCEYPVMSYAVSIDSVEKITGINFFASLPDSLEEKIESDFEIKNWLNSERKKNILPIHRNKLPKGCCNTVQARSHYDEKSTVCGTVVSVNTSNAGNTFINFDQDFPHQIFWCTIWKSNIVNFSYDIKKTLINKKICVKGIIKEKYGNPSISLRHEKSIIFMDN